MSDEAVLRMLGGAVFEPGASLILPSGRELDADEAQALTSFYVDEPETGDGDSVRAPWRFDVPEVPDSVMAFKDRDGKVWCRLHRNQWCLYPVEQYQAKPFRFVMEYAPLVEVVDPRAAS